MEHERLKLVVSENDKEIKSLSVENSDKLALNREYQVNKYDNLYVCDNNN